MGHLSLDCELHQDIDLAGLVHAIAPVPNTNAWSLVDSQLKMSRYNNLQGNANQYHSEISPPTYQIGYNKKGEITTVGENVEKGEHLCTDGGNVNWLSLYGKQYRGSSEIRKRTTK